MWEAQVLIPGSGRSPGEGNGNPLQYSCLENPMDRRAWWATVHGVAKSQIRLSAHTHTQERAVEEMNGASSRLKEGQIIYSQYPRYRNKWEFSDDSVVGCPPAIAGDSGSILRLGRSPGRGNGNLLQYSCLENPMDR